MCGMNVFDARLDEKRDIMKYFSCLFMYNECSTTQDLTVRKVQSPKE